MGVCVHNEFTQADHTLDTHLKAVAVTICLDKLFTDCSASLPSIADISRNSINYLLSQLKELYGVTQLSMFGVEL